MVLAESTPERMTFRFRAGFLGWLTLVIAAALLVPCVWSLLTHSPWTGSLAVVGAFGLLPLYSAIYSFTADQFLWERSGDQFKELRVFRNRGPQGKARNWTIMLVGVDGRELFLGENEIGSLHHERALEVARQVGGLVGIHVVDVNN